MAIVLVESHEIHRHAFGVARAAILPDPGAEVVVSNEIIRRCGYANTDSRGAEVGSLCEIIVSSPRGMLPLGEGLG